MKLTFCGAAKVVTGSCYLMELENKKFLVDCGMFQWWKGLAKKNYEDFLFNPREIDYVFLTHAHIDHSGLIPKLVKHWFRWKIFATGATIDLCDILFEDSAGIQENNIRRENMRRLRMDLEPREPLYTLKDAKKAMNFFAPEVKYWIMNKIDENISVRYQDAGHILGSASIEVFIDEDWKKTKFVFSGDIGQWNVPIIKDPTLISEADYVFIESTYGDRLHEPIGSRDKLLEQYIKKTYLRWWKVLVPSFAIERTQEFLYAVNKLIQEWEFPKEHVFLDSPLAIKATEIFKKHRAEFDQETLNKYTFPFSFKELIPTSSVQESMRLNRYNKPCMVIAGNGMCTAGRIRHHLKHGLWDRRNTLLFIGYQAEWTLGRVILEGADEVRMMWTTIKVNAEIAKINSFSAHADAKELVKWIKWFTTNLKKVFVVHGEEESSMALKEKMELIGFDCHVPDLGEEVSFDE